MKMNNVLAKTGLALAIGAFSMGAMAGTHVVDTGAITLANEIFGAGSEATLVAIPVSTYDVGYTASLAGDVITIKYTLDKGAVFGEDLSDIQKWADSNATLNFVFGVQTEVVGGAGAAYAPLVASSIVVDQGGAIGDNTVTFKIDTTGLTDVSAISVEFGQVRVKNLTSALARGVTNPQVRLGAEFRNVTAMETDTQPAQVVLRSQDGVELQGEATDYEADGWRARIDVADTELSFTGEFWDNTGDKAGADFNAEDNVAFVNLGQIAVARTTYNDGMDLVKKENGDDFDFQGSDQPVITLTSTAALDAYASVYLRPLAGEDTDCNATATAGDFVGVISGNSAAINLSGETTADLEQGYRVCAVAKGTQAIPESDFTASLAVNYFNPRYTNSADTLGYGPVLRNGCQVTLFNVPNVNASDDAFIRLTNVSELPGAVRGYMWTQNGEQIDISSVLQEQLVAHGTTVLHTSAEMGSGVNSVYLGDVMPTFAAQAGGRNRLVLQGAFPACEALGLVRSPNGTLVNMTSTTSSGAEDRLGNDRNNTSNTSN